MRFVQATLGATAMVLICGAGPAMASTSTVLKATVPFAFEVNGRAMPAGTYLIQRDDESSVLIIRGANTGNHAVALVNTQPDNGQDPAGSRPAVTFKRHESDYQLASIWQSAGDGYDVPAAGAPRAAHSGSSHK